MIAKVRKGVKTRVPSYCLNQFAEIFRLQVSKQVHSPYIDHKLKCVSHKCASYDFPIATDDVCSGYDLYQHKANNGSE